MTAIENIQERHDKVYILADDDMHVVLKPLKMDIGYLLKVLSKIDPEVVSQAVASLKEKK